MIEITVGSFNSTSQTIHKYLTIKYKKEHPGRISWLTRDKSDTSLMKGHARTLEVDRTM